MVDPRADLFNLLREDGLDPSVVQALEKLPRSAQARLGSRIVALIEEAVADRLTSPPEAMEGTEVWWIVSTHQEPWAGLRQATFFPATNGPTLCFIQGEADPRRIGVRSWDDIREREGWRKVERIPVPRGNL